MIKSVLNRAHRAISTSKVFAHESLVELESVSMRRYGRSSIVHKNPVALAIGRFSHEVSVENQPQTYVLLTQYSSEGIMIYPAEFDYENLIVKAVPAKVAEEIEGYIRTNPIAILSHEEVKEAAFNGTE